MKFVFRVFILAGLVHLSSCSVLEQAQEYQRFVQCDFSLNTVEILEIGGIKLSEFKNPDELGMLTIMSMTQQLMSGSLPTILRVNLNAKNNNSQKASITGMDWQLFLKENQLLDGVLNQKVEVLSASSAIVPITTSIDILKIFDSQSLDQLLNFAFSNNPADILKELDVSVKIKPHYQVGSEIIKYPAYISINL